jgi:hypothetical protein
MHDPVVMRLVRMPKGLDAAWKDLEHEWKSVERRMDRPCAREAKYSAKRRSFRETELNGTSVPDRPAPQTHILPPA